MPFWSNFKNFFRIPKIRNLKLIVSQLFGVSQLFHHTQNSCYFGVQKTPKMQFYEQVWSVWWLRYSKKLTCNKFEVSDFLNFEKILKIRWKTQKRVIFTKMLFSLRRVKTALVKWGSIIRDTLWSGSERQLLVSTFLSSQVAPNWVKVATDGNIFGDKTFFEVSLKNFLFTLWPCWRYLKGPPWLVLYASKKIVTIRYTDRIIWKEKGSILGFEKMMQKLG